MMNSKLRKKTAERGETCSAKGTHRLRKCKAGNGKGPKGRSTKYEVRKGMECGMRNGRITRYANGARREEGSREDGTGNADCGMGDG